MTTDKDILREKLNNHFATIFEDELIDEIIENGILRKIESNELLIDIGDKMTHIPLILSGAVKIIREDDKGDEIALYFLEKGDTCAISFINCLHKTESIFRGVTERETESIFIPVDKIDQWLKNYESWRHFIIDSYHMRLLEMVESIDSLAFMKLDDRLLKYLTDKVKIMKDNVLKITHQDIADDLNTSRVVVSRLLKILEKEGKIKIRRNRIIIDNI
ncbi:MULTISPECIES: Crp/Fnr family transcriptional regulator [Flavobacteriaceae]|uniref:Crp/Fnr family transcriptional regulator n=2 Tax=Flavobacteriaceae TaxID=49546 RepID=A0A4Y8AX77_9FLAO|nr:MULTISPECIES: Crp/Fnr family transcriptional regulator [Flavobacteriaceae]TEW77079.1 Crp/Fnr family transcriptional regulator [Gramella jeungdoensis]GGK58058.1 Crp/Fnr family transcriptional regulator [Lutibacter litoralis]